MTAKHLVFLAILLFDGLVMVVKGLAGASKTYTPLDALSAIVEIPLLAWLALS